NSGHGLSVYQEEIRVPLLFVHPGALPARTVDAGADLIDVMPTILKYCGISISGALVQGRDLFGAEEFSRVMFSSRYVYPRDPEVEQFGGREFYAVIEPPWKLIVE